MATDAQAARPRDAEMALAQARSLPKPPLAQPPPTRQTARKGRLNFLYFKAGFLLPEIPCHCAISRVLPVPRGAGTRPDIGVVRPSFPLSSLLTLTNRSLLAPAESLSRRVVTRVSRRAVGDDDWSSNRNVRTEGRQSPMQFPACFRSNPTLVWCPTIFRWISSSGKAREGEKKFY